MILSYRQMIMKLNEDTLHSTKQWSVLLCLQIPFYVKYQDSLSKWENFANNLVVCQVPGTQDPFYQEHWIEPVIWVPSCFAKISKAHAWFKIAKRVCQGHILSPYLFNYYVEYIMRNAQLDEVQDWWDKISITSDMQMTWR